MPFFDITVGRSMPGQAFLVLESKHLIVAEFKLSLSQDIHVITGRESLCFTVVMFGYLPLCFQSFQFDRFCNTLVHVYQFVCVV